MLDDRHIGRDCLVIPHADLEALVDRRLLLIHCEIRAPPLAYQVRRGTRRQTCTNVSSAGVWSILFSPVNSNCPSASRR